MNKRFLQKLFAIVGLFIALHVNATNISVTTDITSNTTWTNNNTYILYGDIIVKNGATLSIQEGTIIKGDKTTLSRLIIATGAKILAQGTPEQPIVFTSNQAAGSRNRADWAGLAICGLAPVNFRDGGGNAIQGRLECGNSTDYDFGGNNPADNSGVLSYVRIEYAGYVCGSNSELNSLTLGGVGYGTKIDHVMVTYGQDDGFEWFGGTVNADHIVSFGSRDDDFDTDNGFNGKVQFGLVIRVDSIADQGDVSNAFESDNDANGTYNDPYTKAVFSNITVVGPAATATSTIDVKYGWGARLRRNTGLNIFNSVFMGYKRGLRIEGTGSQTKATTDTLEFKNNIIAGSKEQYYETSFDSLYLLTQNSNTIFGGNANDALNLGSPYGNPDQFNFIPQTGSPALIGASFTNAKLNTLTSTTYRGAFGTENWLACWAEFSPQNENYTSSPVNYAPNVNISQSGTLPSVTLSADNIAGAAYNWSTGSIVNTATVTAVGTYTLTVTTSRGCVKTFTATVSTVGIKEMNTNITSLNLSPNPNTGAATLQVSSNSSSDVTVNVTDITGRDLSTMSMALNNGLNQITINTSTFANGVYFVVVKNDSENKVVRMVVNK